MRLSIVHGSRKLGAIASSRITTAGRSVSKWSSFKESTPKLESKGSNTETTDEHERGVKAASSTLALNLVLDRRADSNCQRQASPILLRSF